MSLVRAVEKRRALVDSVEQTWVRSAASSAAAAAAAAVAGFLRRKLATHAALPRFYGNWASDVEPDLNVLLQLLQLGEPCRGALAALPDLTPASVRASLLAEFRSIFAVTSHWIA